MGVFSNLDPEKQSKYENMLKNLKSDNKPNAQKSHSDIKNKLDYEISSIKIDIDEKLEKLEKDSERLNKAKVLSKSLNQEIEKKNSAIRELKNQRGVLESEIAKMSQKIKTFEDQNASSSDLQLPELQKQENSLRQEIQEAQRKLEVSKKELEGIHNEQLDYLKENRFIQDMQKSIIIYRDQLMKISSERAEIEIEIKRQMKILEQEKIKERDIIKKITSEFRN